MRKTFIKQILTPSSVSFKLPFSIALFPDQEGPTQWLYNIKNTTDYKYRTRKKKFHLAKVVEVIKRVQLCSPVCIYICVCVHTIYIRVCISVPVSFSTLFVWIKLNICNGAQIQIYWLDTATYLERKSKSALLYKAEIPCDVSHRPCISG